jgi:lincosamide nucleotidyltransferase A/C/D/E
MNASDVTLVLNLFSTADVDVWIGGGWGVDALAGRQTRDHLDLDLLFNRDHEGRVIALLSANAYSETIDWRPGRFVMNDGTRELDLHPLEMLDAGDAILRTHTDQTFAFRNVDFVEGVIDNRVVPCLSAAKQWEFHQGYEPTAKDLHDLEVLQVLLEDS